MAKLRDISDLRKESLNDSMENRIFLEAIGEIVDSGGTCVSLEYNEYECVWWPSVTKEALRHPEVIEKYGHLKGNKLTIEDMRDEVINNYASIAKDLRGFLAKLGESVDFDGTNGYVRYTDKWSGAILPVIPTISTHNFIKKYEHLKENKLTKLEEMRKEVVKVSDMSNLAINLSELGEDVDISIYDTHVAYNDGKWVGVDGPVKSINQTDFIRKYRVDFLEEMRGKYISVPREEFDRIADIFNLEENYTYSVGIQVGYNAYDGLIFNSSNNSMFTEISLDEFQDIYDTCFNKQLLQEPIDPKDPPAPKPKPKPKPKSAVWNNPTPQHKNTREIIEGQLVAINGHELGFIAKSVGDKYLLSVTNEVQIINGLTKDTVYPLYETKEFSIGNIIQLKNLSFDVITKKSSDVIQTTLGETKEADVIAIYSKTPDVVTLSKYSCGTIVDQGVTYTNLKEFNKANPNIKTKVTEMNVSYDYHAITKHYNIKDLVCKDSSIHEELMTTLEHPLNVAAKEWALLVGPSGSGKTTACVNFAKAVKRPYIKLQGNAQVTQDDLIGYKSITDGRYFPSLLREAVEKGYVFILDEIDSMNPNTLLVLNGLKQDYFQFPDALIEIHEDFRFMATANSLEYSEEYNARTPMDKASLARFDVIHYDMREAELALRYGLNYVKDIDDIKRLTPREVERLVNKMKIKETK